MFSFILFYFFVKTKIHHKQKYYRTLHLNLIHYLNRAKFKITSYLPMKELLSKQLSHLDQPLLLRERVDSVCVCVVQGMSGLFRDTQRSSLFQDSQPLKTASLILFWGMASPFSLAFLLSLVSSLFSLVVKEALLSFTVKTCYPCWSLDNLNIDQLLKYSQTNISSSLGK